MELPLWQYCNFNLIPLGIPALPMTWRPHVRLDRLTSVRPFLSCYLNRLVNDQLTSFCYSFSNLFCASSAGHWSINCLLFAFLIRYRRRRVTNRLIDFVEICFPFSYFKFLLVSSAGRWSMVGFLFAVLFVPCTSMRPVPLQEGKSPTYVLRFLSSEHQFDRMIIFLFIIVATSLEGLPRKPLATRSAQALQSAAPFASGYRCDGAVQSSGPSPNKIYLIYKFLHFAINFLHFHFLHFLHFFWL